MTNTAPRSKSVTRSTSQSNIRIADGDEVLPSGEKLKDIRSPEADLNDFDCPECSIAAERNLQGLPAVADKMPAGLTPQEFEIWLNRGEGVYLSTEKDLVERLLSEGEGTTAIVSAMKKKGASRVEDEAHVFAVRVENGVIVAYDPTLLLQRAREVGEDFLGITSVYRLFF